MSQHSIEARESPPAAAVTGVSLQKQRSALRAARPAVPTDLERPIPDC